MDIKRIVRNDRIFGFYFLNKRHFKVLNFAFKWELLILYLSKKEQLFVAEDFFFIADYSNLKEVKEIKLKNNLCRIVV
jgi:hypothetical protein